MPISYDMGIFIAYSFLGILFWFLWNLIHEFSHIIAIKSFKKLSWWKIYPYPHMVDNKFYWARAVWGYKDTASNLAGGQKFVTYFSPRFAGIVAGIMFMISFLIPSTLQISWIIFSLFGMIDLAWGSIGFNKNSDLRIASDSIKLNPWVLRIFGMLYFGFSLFVGIIFLI